MTSQERNRRLEARNQLREEIRGQQAERMQMLQEEERILQLRSGVMVAHEQDIRRELEDEFMKSLEGRSSRRGSATLSGSQISQKKPDLKIKLSKVDTDQDIGMQVSYLLARAEALLAEFSDSSVLAALEHALPGDITRRHNRTGDKNCREFVHAMKETYNSTEMLENASRELESAFIASDDSLIEPIVDFINKKDDFNARCDLAGPRFLHLKWCMHRTVEFINNRLIPESRRSYRADFASSRLSKSKIQHVEEWTSSTVRSLLEEVEIRQTHLRSSQPRLNAVGDSQSREKEDVCVRCDKVQKFTGRFFCPCGKRVTCGQEGCRGNHLPKHHERVMSWGERKRKRGDNERNDSIAMLKSKIAKLKEKLEQ